MKGNNTVATHNNPGCLRISTFSGICLIYSLLIGATAPAFAEPGKKNILFIVDASGSMNEYLGAYQKMHIAKKEISRIVKKLPIGSEAGLIAYGNRVHGCGSARLYVPMEKDNSPQFLPKLQGLTPTGSTPLALTLKVAGDYLATHRKEIQIVLVSDGIESCGGDPLKELRSLQNKGYPVSLSIIGLGVSGNEEGELKNLSRQGGGKYFSIQSDKDIGNAFDDIFPDAGKTDIGGPEKENLPYIKIKNITEMRRDGRIKQCRITYEFMDIPGRKDHSAFLKIRLSEIVTKTIVPEFRSKSPEGIAKTTAVHHTGNMGEGGIDVELPVDFTFEANVELWDISGVPDAIAISKSISF